MTRLKDAIDFTFALLQGKPTTIAGYGITDAASSASLAAHESDTTSVHGIADTSTLYRAGGTDVAVADGGTGASTAAAARTALGTNDATNITTGTLVPAYGGTLAIERTLSTGSIGVPGVEFSTMTTQVQTANRTYYEQFEVRKACTLTELFTEVTGAGAGSSVTRLGVYAADNVGTPGALVVDAGTVACDSTGVKSITGLSVALAPGFYMKARNSTGAPTLRIIRGGSRLAGIDSGMGGTPMFSQRYVNATIGAFPDPATAPASASVSATPFEHGIFMKVTGT